MKYKNLNGHNFAIKNLKYQYSNYIRSNAGSLDDVYGRYSKAKKNAFRCCDNLRRKLCGYDGAIVSVNCQMFTYGFTFDCEGTEYFAYLTRYYDYACPVEDCKY